MTHGADNRSESDPTLKAEEPHDVLKDYQRGPPGFEAFHQIVEAPEGPRVAAIQTLEISREGQVDAGEGSPS